MQTHKRALTEDEFLQLLKAHVAHGFALIKNDTAGFKFEVDYVDYLVELTCAGLEQRSREPAPQIETTPAYKRFTAAGNRLRGERLQSERLDLTGGRTAISP